LWVKEKQLPKIRDWFWMNWWFSFNGAEKTHLGGRADPSSLWRHPYKYL